MCEQSLYFVIHLYLVILVGVFCCVLSNLPQYPGVVSGARRCFWLAVNQGVRVLSLTTVREVRFADLAILRAQCHIVVCAVFGCFLSRNSHLQKHRIVASLQSSV